MDIQDGVPVEMSSSFCFHLVEVVGLNGDGKANPV